MRLRCLFWAALMSKDGLGPYIPIYWDDLVGGTLDFGADEFGAYMLLLGHQWTRGGIDPSPQVVERISRCEYRKLSRVIEKFNLCPDGMLRNKRMECVRNERIAYVQTRSKSAKARWCKVHTDMRTHVHTDMRSGMRKEDIPSPSPSPSLLAHPNEETIAHRGVSDDGFAAFWKAYPKRVGKEAALKAWKRAKKPSVEIIIAKLNTLKASDQWRKDGGQFIPHPATWINRGGWDDECGQAATSSIFAGAR
jgi:uncharacterized protein YdaU (DUF1376 family)